MDFGLNNVFQEAGAQESHTEKVRPPGGSDPSLSTNRQHQQLKRAPSRSKRRPNHSDQTVERNWRIREPESETSSTSIDLVSVTSYQC